MAIRFVLGTSGSGKTWWCVNAIADALRKGGDEPLVFLVPEQATFQAERAILSCSDIGGYHRLQVLSFNRLQFQLCKTVTQSDLSPLGRQMLVRQALSACQNRLHSLQASALTPGMAVSLADLIRRLHEDNCSPQQLEITAQAILAKEPQSPTGWKFADIALVYDEYLKLLSHPECDFFNPDSLLTEARGKVKDAAFLRGARLWVDGFSGFTLQQRDLLFEMLAVCKDADIALCLDPQAIDLADPDPDKLDGTSLFAPTEQTCIDLLTIMKRCKMPVGEPVILNQHPRFAAAGALEQIERHFADGTAKSLPAGDTIEIRGLSDIRTEAAFIACRIGQLVRTQKLRYRDIAVIVPDIGLYAHYLAGAFEPYKIPYFLDRPQSLQTHPLVELLIAALRAAQTGFEAGSVQMLLKADFNGLGSLQADILDNYCRAFGVGSREWFLDTAWDFGDTNDPLFEPARIDALRRKFFAPFGELYKVLQDNLTATQCVNALWRLVEQLNIHKMLAAESLKDTDDSQFAHRRVWKKLQEALEELTAIFGKQLFAGTEIIAILLDVFSSLTLKQIPAAVDQVLIGSIERSRHPEIKIAFLAGATYKLFPVPPAADVLLTEQDAQLAARENLPLTTPMEQMLTARRYLSYIALTRASHKLVITFSTTDDDAPAAPWPGLERICALCPDVKIQYGTPVEMLLPQNLSAAALGQWFCAMLGPESTCDKQTKTLAHNLLSCCKASTDETQTQLCREVEYALAWRNEAALDKEVISRLITWPMRTSASRLATFATCPYQYFARYTLGLKKRNLLRLMPVDIGDFYHMILNRLFLDLYRRNQDWTTAGNDVLSQQCDRIAKEYIQEDRHLAAFVRGCEYNTYIIEEAVSNLKDFLPALAAVGAAGVFRQKAAEMEFGINNPPVIVEAAKKQLIQLNGRIDRVDCADIDGQWTAIVIDYKSGSTTRKMNWTKFFHGLDVQLAVYCLALQRQTIENRPIEAVAGAFYIPLEQSLETSFKKTDDDSGSTVKARGIFDGQFAKALDTQCESKSAFYSLNWKDGEPYGYPNSSDALRPNDFAATLRFAAEKIRTLGLQMASGDIRAFPYRLGTQSPCSTCDYRPVCKFDWQLNDYNVLTRPGKLEVLQQLTGGQSQ